MQCESLWGFGHTPGLVLARGHPAGVSFLLLCEAWGRSLGLQARQQEPVLHFFLTLFKSWSGEFTIFSMISHLINISVITGESSVSSGLAMEIFVFTNNHTLSCMVHASCSLTFLPGHISQISGLV